MSFLSTFDSLSVRGWRNESVLGTNLQLQQSISSPVQSNNFNFGVRLGSSFDGNYIIVDTSTTQNTYIYSYSSSSANYLLQATLPLSSSPGINGDGNIAIGGQTSFPIPPGTGQLAVYNRSGNIWSLSQTLTPSVYVGNDGFGLYSAINKNGNIILVGTVQPANGAIVTFFNSGNTYVETQRIVLPGPTPPSIQQKPLNISGDGNYFIVGCSFGNASANCYADVYVKSGNTYNYQTRLIPNDTTLGDKFGESVSLNYDGSIALIGAPNKNSNAGAAYTFSRSGNTWTQLQKLVSNKATANDYFGTSSFISSDSSVIIIGAPLEDTGGSERGSAFVYYNLNNNFYLAQELLANNSSNNDQFGYSVTISNGPTYIASVGAPVTDNPPITNIGTVYVYTG